jgi:eukaryotic-like serine/threonine-protein kinase
VQACEALAEAHAAGIVHRDIKPHNLFLAKAVGGAKKIKVLDFGVSKALSISSGGVGGLTSTRTMIGSPLYMSPEQMRSSRDVDARSDVWSLGVVLFELLSKATPFEADSMPELCLKVVSEPPRRLVALRPELPPDLAAVVERCLEKDPARRFANAAELATALEPFTPPTSHVVIERARMAMGSLASVETTSRRPSQTRVDSNSATVVSQEIIAVAPAAGRKAPWIVIAAGATALAALGGFVSIRSHHERAPGPATVVPVDAPAPTPATSLVPPAVPETRAATSTIPSTAPSTTSPAIPAREAVTTSRSAVSHVLPGSGQSPPSVQKPSKPVHDDDIPALR